jgi:crotonobetainyl-CoA:carnitine CoA-transferase CaiB-like acyl-CoA transferase
LTKVLEGITVLDLTRVVAGPACTRTLADYGADVIKIEPPEGDLLRRGVPKANGVSLPFAQQNAGKELLSIDLGDPRGQDIALKLATTADVLVENYRPGVASRLGLGYDDVAKINPSIVYCSISGYGQTGSAAGRRAYAPVIHAELGLLHLNARERGTDPLPESVSHVDFAVGSQAATAILAALLYRERTGKGQHVDVSMAETMLATNEFCSVEVNGGFGDEISPFRPGRAALLKLKDGTWVQVPGNPTTWIFGVARALRKEAEMEARGWLAPKDTQGCDDEIRELMQAWAGEFASVADFEAALDSARIPLGTVKAVADVIDEQWARERDAFVSVDINGTERWVPRSPTRFSQGDSGPSTGANLRGAHNHASLKARLGLTDAELDELDAAGVLCYEKTPSAG